MNIWEVFSWLIWNPIKKSSHAEVLKSNEMILSVKIHYFEIQGCNRCAWYLHFYCITWASSISSNGIKNLTTLYMNLGSLSVQFVFSRCSIVGCGSGGMKKHQGQKYFTNSSRLSSCCLHFFNFRTALEIAVCEKYIGISECIQTFFAATVEKILSSCARERIVMFKTSCVKSVMQP